MESVNSLFRLISDQCVPVLIASTHKWDIDVVVLDADDAREAHAQIAPKDVAGGCGGRVRGELDTDQFSSGAEVLVVVSHLGTVEEEGREGSLI